MNITNELNLPEAIHRACANDDYTRGESDISVTQLIAPAQKRVLTQENSDSITEDCSNMLWALMGKAMHKILEDGADENSLREDRLYADFGNYRISGQFDRYDMASAILQDYKFSSVWEYIHGLKFEREAQLNLLAWLMRENGTRVEGLEVVFLFRDWSKSKAKFDSSYPQHQIVAVPVRMWSDEELLMYLDERIQDHFYNVPECSDEDRWAKPTVYAHMREGRKSAVKLHKTEEDALAAVEEDAKGYLEVRHGENTRCEHYCSAAPFCAQFKALKEAQDV